MRYIISAFFLVAVTLSGVRVEQYSKIFVDPARNNRQINTVIYYPAEGQQGEENLPYIVFGHGWIMNHSNYQQLTDMLVNSGLIVAFPRTEEGLFPNHYEFALDLSFLQAVLYAENLNPDSPLYLRILAVPILMGHSMGGGAAVLAAAMDNGYASLITFAAAETNVSAIQAAQNVQIPSITFSGSADTITPPAQHQIPIYNNLGSDYKSHITFNGAGHLNLYNNTLIPTILYPFIEYLKTGDIGDLDAFEAVLMDNQDNLSFQIENNLWVSLDQHLAPALPIQITNFPNPFTSKTSFQLAIPKSSHTELNVYNLKGQKVRALHKGQLGMGRHSIDWNGYSDAGKRLPPGVYLYSLSTDIGSVRGKLLLRSR